MVFAPVLLGLATVVVVSAEAGFEWVAQPVPVGMPVVQVYGWLLDDAGRVLVQDTGSGHNLPGGTPEPFDADPAATATREALEESQVKVRDLVYMGYERSVRDGSQVALVRTVGRSDGSASSCQDARTLTVAGCWAG